MSKNIIVDNDYADLITSIKQTVKGAQLKAHRAVNTELIKLYWTIGKELLARQKVEAWGSKYLEQVSKDLQLAFPGMKGFSTTNLKYMRAFAQEYPGLEFGHQLGDQLLPWRSIVDLFTKVKKRKVRDWYAHQAVKEGWSRSVLNMMIKQDLHASQNKPSKITNFKETLPALQSGMAQELFKDPYNFEFLNIVEPTKERDIENALVTNIRDFLLQLGQGFAFVGNQYHLKIGQTDFYLDCLFYNFKMRCFVVIELKTGKFKAEYTGQLNLYLTGIDRLVKSAEDNPTIGLVLCETKDEVVAQYAVDGMTKPMGISQYDLGAALTQHLKIIRESKVNPSNKVEESICEEN